jgi:broad specificity phosphatase PhoE
VSAIYLIRHGEITQSSPRRFVGQTDLPLTERGREQIAAVAAFLSGRGVARLVCSLLSRCVESAAILGRALDMPLENLFRLGQDYACINILKAGIDEYRVEAVNRPAKL